MEVSSNIIKLTQHNLVFMTFCESFDIDQYSAAFPSCSTGSWKSLWIVSPPVLKATATFTYLDGQIFPTRSLMALISKNLPVPPIPLTNILIGLKSHWHSPLLFCFWCWKWLFTLSNMHMPVGFQHGHPLIQTQLVRWVAHDFYWKKEYQAHGAPHYHVLLWIRDAPVIGQDDPGEERITCHIPNKESDTELYNLVIRYQMYKCSGYCKHKMKCGNVFITRCKFGLPQQPYDRAKLNSVINSLKPGNRMYQLVWQESETRVNDYNPLFLMLWKANIDIQFVAESLLALAHYVSGYITKAEK